ncbi:MAG: alpha/beta hydrolase [Gammaproteobacteria bacterium]|nr:alpha/beta hydrolase [Gammaproteobacteria bacterium]
MTPSESLSVTVRGLEYHCRSWGREGQPKLFMLHGFQDNSASWQFTVDALQRDWHVIAPDWRGYGLSQWSGHDTYYYADLMADLDVLLDHFEPEEPARIVAHSMGATTASLYSGSIPMRIAKFVNIEGLGGPAAQAEEAPRRYARWLEQLARPPRQRPYMDFEEFAERMMSENPNLTRERAEFLVRHWGQEEPDGTVVRRADPAHMLPRPNLFRLDEALACWRQIEAPVLFVEGEQSRSIHAMRGQPEGYEERLSAFQTLAGIEEITGAGHNVHHDQPEKLARVIEEFL